MTIAKNDVEKLPKWAQRRIRYLEQKIEALENQVADEEKTGLYWYTPTVFGSHNYLPDKHTYIVFKFKGVRANEEITINRDSDGLRISATGQIKIAPRAANTVQVTLDEL